MLAGGDFECYGLITTVVSSGLAIIWPMRLLQKLGRLLTSSQPISQPIPQVTPDDVERIVRRDFSADDYSAVTAMLNEYGTEKWHQESTRARLAALKLANGSVRRLRVSIDSAKRDYRNALAVAEYPTYFNVGSRVRELPIKERNRIVDEDWRQYEKWLQK
jgi:hypothetical protein